MQPAASFRYDVTIIGGGAAGLFCALHAGRRGRRVLLLDHQEPLGEKIRISGGGRCNFTNLHTSPANFISTNPRFCVSALSRYTPHDFITLLRQHGIGYHEKTLGQLFCDESARQIISMLLNECRQANVTFSTGAPVRQVAHTAAGFTITTGRGVFSSPSVVVATGGLSIPKIGASGFGYEIAQQFGLDIIPTRPGLVPFTLPPEILLQLKTLAGIAVEGEAAFGKHCFREGILFTHRGLSGPAILQISSYWQTGKPVTLNLAPTLQADTVLKEQKSIHGRQLVPTVLAHFLPKRLGEYLSAHAGCNLLRLADLSGARLEALARQIAAWQLLPSGTEGYRTAEVTCGGVDTRALSSTTMESREVPGLYFIGEVVDVTGHLGGFNFQWAWSSAYAAAQSV